MAAGRLRSSVPPKPRVPSSQFPLLPRSPAAISIEFRIVGSPGFGFIRESGNQALAIWGLETGVLSDACLLGAPAYRLFCIMSLGIPTVHGISDIAHCTVGNDVYAVLEADMESLTLS